MISWFLDVKDRIPKLATVSDISELEEFLVQSSSDNKATAEMWAPGERTSLKKDGVGKTNFLVLDYDDNEPEWENFESLGYIAHTTHSHADDSPHWRVIFQLEEPSAPEGWTERYRDFVENVDPGADLACSDPTRRFYVPPTGAIWRSNHGGKVSFGTHSAGETPKSNAPEWQDVPDSVLDAAVQYASLIEPSIEGQRGDDQLFRVARELRTSFCLPSEAVLAILETSFNPRCVPPWDDYRLRRASERSALDNACLPGGGLTRDQRKALQGQLDAAGIPGFDALGLPGAVSAAELAKKLPPVEWLSKALGIPTAGRCHILVSFAGGGKTLSMQDLALSVASGQGHWLPGIDVGSGPVVHIDCDQGRYATAYRYQQLAAGRGKGPEWLASLPLTVVSADSLNVANAKPIENQLRDAKLCIIDSLRTILIGEENTNDAGSVIRALSRISESTKCAIIVLHHEGKPNESFDARHAARGSTAIVDRAGCVWRISPCFAGKRPIPGYVRWEQTKRSEFSITSARGLATKVHVGSKEASFGVDGVSIQLASEKEIDMLSHQMMREAATQAFTEREADQPDGFEAADAAERIHLDKQVKAGLLWKTANGRYLTKDPHG